MEFSKFHLIFSLILLNNYITYGVYGQNTIERTMPLGNRIIASWVADFEKELIIFQVTAETKGFIGFGFNPQGGMSNADVIIGGVDDAGQPYFTDRWATGKTEPQVDEKQDWILLEALENETHTVLKFQRLFDTCDEMDLQINNDTTKFIWSLGASDKIEYHIDRGVASVNILDPYIPPIDSSQFDSWHINVNTTIPITGDPPDTSYFCTGHKSDKYLTKRHIVGFKVKLENELAIKHNHHLVLYQCHAQAGSVDEDVLEEFIKTQGGDCYDDSMSKILDLCPSYLYVWAKGGDPLYLPQNVGFPLNEFGTADYFLLEIHYDNPEMIEGVQYETGIEVLTTDVMRPVEAGLLVVGHVVASNMIVPPNVTDYVITGHCGPQCTTTYFPPDGITLFNVLLHSHLSGRKLKLRHFRPTEENGTFVELPWISYDNNYDFNYQQNRPLRNELKFLPGDQLSYECTYDSTWRSPPSATLGGASTKHEMCETFLMYYPRIPSLGGCASEIGWPVFEALGIQQFDNSSNGNNPIILKPEEMNGKNLTTVLDQMIVWTDDLKDQLQKVIHDFDHTGHCFGYDLIVNKNIPDVQTKTNDKSKPQEDQLVFIINYPNKFEEYIPPESTCNQQIQQ